MATEVILPKLGQTMEEGAIIDWLVQEGDKIKRGDVLFTVESDKATLEVESPGRGYLRKILVAAGETVPVLSVVGLITKTEDEELTEQHAGGESVPDQPAVAPSAESAAADSASPGTQTASVVRGRVFSSPRARKLAREKGIVIEQVTGTGPGGRIVERDVVAFLESAPKATPVALRLAQQAHLDLRSLTGTGPAGKITKDDVQAALAAEVPAHTLVPVVRPVSAAPSVEPTQVPMSGIRASIARRMSEAHLTTAPVTLTTEVDATELVTLRERLKAKLADQLGFNVGYNDILIRLAAFALREFPYMNARLDGEMIVQLADVHVALAVDTDRGLLVPVIRDADSKGVAEIASYLRELVARARDSKALPDELSGSTFTITNLGMHEIDAFTPIINMPETAILGVGRIKAQPAVVDGEIVIRQMLWLSLTFYHRLVDGAPAARFLQRIKQLVEEPYLLLT